jgi:hypothetical protein
VYDPVVPVLSAVPTAPAEREQFWRDAVATFNASGLSVRAFCAARGLHERRFDTWRKALGLSPVDARPAAPVSGTRPVPGFVPVRLVADTAAEVANRSVRACLVRRWVRVNP